MMGLACSYVLEFMVRDHCLFAYWLIDDVVVAGGEGWQIVKVVQGEFPRKLVFCFCT